MKDEKSVNRGERIKIVGEYIDLSSFKPPGLEAEVSEDSVTLIRSWWMRGVKKTCTIKIKRYVNAERFADFLGLQRAEGYKKNDRVRFTNKDIQLHKRFIDTLREMGVKKSSAHTYYNEARYGKEKLEKAIREFKDITGVNVKNVYFNQLAFNPLFQVDVNNRVLAIFVNYAEKIFREEAVRTRLQRKLVARYLRGVFDGDGDIELRVGKGKRDNRDKVNGVHIKISEKDNNVAMDLLKILKRYFGIEMHSYSYAHLGSLDIQDILLLIREDLVPLRHRDKIVKRLEIAFKRKRLPWILLQLAKAFGDGYFTASEVSKILKRARHHTRETLDNLERKGYLKSIKEKITLIGPGTPIRRMFKLTGQAFEVINLLSSLPLSFLFGKPHCKVIFYLI